VTEKGAEGAVPVVEPPPAPTAEAKAQEATPHPAPDKKAAPVMKAKTAKKLKGK
jgi:hypothetical protein